MTSLAWQAVERARRERAGEPVLVDIGSQGRTELSAISFENAVAKAANALLDPLDTELGDVVVIDLPVHWQRAVWTMAVWTVGGIVRVGGVEAALADGDCSLIITHGDAVTDEVAHGSSGVPVGVVSLHPLGLPGPPVPGAEDLSVLARLAPDGLLAPEVPPSAPALVAPDDAAPMTQGQCRAYVVERLTQPGRVLLQVDHLTPLDALLLPAWGPVSAGTSIVLASGTADTETVIRTERIAWSIPAI